jgi:hypothetical protein
MLIKITSITDDELGGFDAKLIVGDRIDNGKEWQKKCFSNNQKLMDELSDFGVGEIVNVRMAKGKGTNKAGFPNWNIAGFEEASQDLIDSVKGKGDVNPSVESPKVSGASGYSKSTWNGRTGEAYDRSASVYLAFDIIKSVKTEAAMRKMNALEFVDAIFTLGNKINNYIHNGDDGSDPLNPPTVD